MILRKLYSDAELDREIALLKEAGIQIVPEDVHAFRITREYLENMDQDQRAALAKMRKKMGPENFRRMIFRILQENEGKDVDYPMHGEPRKKGPAGPGDETQEVPFSQEKTKTVPIRALGPDVKTRPIPRREQPESKPVRTTPEGLPIAEPVTVLPTTKDEVIKLLRGRGISQEENPEVSVNMRDDISDAPTVPVSVNKPRETKSPKDFNITRDVPRRYNSDWLSRFIADN